MTPQSDRFVLKGALLMRVWDGGRGKEAISLTPIYHITHLRNLTSILDEGGLWCDGIADDRNLADVDIAHAHIKARRQRKKVPAGAGGCLADYVPFYFAPRSPMLYAIHTGAVAEYRGDQASVVHLVASAEMVAQRGLAYVFSDGHAVMALSDFFDDLRGLDAIDWQIMRERFWADTDEDPDRKRRRQAEFLVHRFLPWNLVTEIGVLQRGTGQEVRQLLRSQEHRPEVRERRGWYY